MSSELVGRFGYRGCTIEVHELWEPCHLMQSSFVSVGHGVRWRNEWTGQCFTELRFLFPNPNDALNHAVRMIDD